MYSRGEEISELVTEYTQQMIELQVTSLYYYCLSLRESIAALQSQIAAAESLAAQLRSLVEEGMLSSWRADEAAVFVRSLRNDLQKTRDTLQQTRGDLLMAMGLSPLATIELGEPQNDPPPQGPLEDLIYQAMLNHPQLKIADRVVAIEEEKVKIAIAAFLPRLYGFATHTTTTDSQIVDTRYWMAGLSGTLSIFNGFANINSYEAAKQSLEKAFLEREQQTLTLMAEMQRAYLNLQTAANDKVLAEKNLAVAQARHDEMAERWKEGLVTSTDLLSVLASRDQARMGVMMASYHYQVSVATMRQVMGLVSIDTDMEIEKR
jgi:outer membrane protein TolC